MGAPHLDSEMWESTTPTPPLSTHHETGCPTNWRAENTQVIDSAIEQNSQNACNSEPPPQIAAKPSASAAQHGPEEARGSMARNRSLSALAIGRQLRSTGSHAYGG
jgi:hypothetical protein